MATLAETLTSPAMLGASGLILISWWKVLFLPLIFIPWAILISKIYDKHAAQFHLPRRQWNTFHLCMGLLAITAYLLMPIKNDFAFLVSFFAALLILGIDIVAYAYIANKDERVPERFHIKINMEKFAEAREAKKKQKQQATVSLAIKGPDKQLVPAPMAETPEFAVRAAAEEIYTKGLETRSSQVDIVPTGKDGLYAPQFVIDGIRQNGEPMPAQNALRIMDFWKACAKLDLADRRRKLSGQITVEKDTFKHTLRVTSIGAQGGMRITLLIDPEDAVKRKIKDSGLLDSQMEELTAIVQEEKGTVVLAAPAHAGRTSTMYSIVSMHDAYTKNVQIVEMDPQASLEGVRSNKFEADKEGSEFSTTVRSVRRDPDVVAVAELPDANTAKEVARADKERTRTYVSVRADNAISAVQTWVKAVGEPKSAAEALHGVLAQKLLRKLCPNCRVAYPPSAEMLKKLGIPEGKVQQLFKKGGQVLIKNKPEICPVCQGGGYYGQTGIYEVYRIGPEERELVASGNLAGLKAQFRKRQLPTIQQAAIRKAIDGTTSVEEVMRVTTEAQPAAAPKPGPAAGAPSNGPVAAKPPAPAAG